MASRTPPSDALAAWLAGRRWFATKTRRIAGVAVEDVAPLAGGALVVARVTLDGGGEDRYALPLLPPQPGDDIRDALDDAGFCRALLELIGRDGVVRGERGQLRGVRAAAFPRTLPDALTPRRLGGEQSNTSIAFGDALIMKHFRRLAIGRNPEEEITRFLTERARFDHTPRLAGHLEYRRDGETMALAVVQELIAGARDGWEWTLDALAESGRRDATLTMLARLADATAALHRALAMDRDDDDFAPEPVTGTDLATWASAVRTQLASAAAAVGERRLAGDLAIEDGLAALTGTVKIRHHGDFHLGQTLYREATAEPFIIDFEGEPLRSLAERRRKHTPLRDVAGLLRSIDYAAVTAAGAAEARWAADWRRRAARVFVERYRAGTRGAQFVPAGGEAFAGAVAVFEVEKAAYEIVYEANNRPDWVPIPRRGLLSAAASLRRASAEEA